MAQSASVIIRRFNPATREHEFVRDGIVIARAAGDGHGHAEITGEIPDGIVLSYYQDEDGRSTAALFARWNYLDNRLHGLSSIYDRDGRLAEEIEYEDGIIDRVVLKHYESGELSFESELHRLNGGCSLREGEALLHRHR